MKRFITIFFLGLLCLFFIGCEVSDSESSEAANPQVRFQNAFSDGTYIQHGIRLGSAQYTGQLLPGEVTSYYSTSAGTFSVQLYDGTNWFTDSFGSFIIDNNHKYTITITGIITDYYYLIVQDSK